MFTFVCIVILVMAIGGAEDERAIVALPDGSEVVCQLADSPQKRAIGLSRHTELPEGTGMLFVYPEPRETSFWMPPEMRFSLDIVFMDAEYRVVHIAADAPPCPDPKGWDCPGYSPDQPVSWVLEIPAGSATRHRIAVGETLTVRLPAGYRMPKL